MKEIKRKTKKEGLKQVKETLENKPLHGQYPQRSHQADVNQANTYWWLLSVGLKTKTQRFVMSAQDQSIYPRNYQARIKNEVSFKYRMCDQYDKTVDHLVSCCPVIHPTEYKSRYDRVCQYIHWKVWRYYKALYHKICYECKPESVVETECTTISWDLAIHTDRKIDI